MLRGAAPAVDQQLDWLTVVLMVLVQAERRDPAESLLWCCWLTDLEHERHDRLLTWLRKLGMLQAGAPHFRLTAWGHVVLAGLRCVGRLCAARRYGSGRSDRRSRAAAGWLLLIGPGAASAHGRG